jgi:hypothetical protein
MPSIKFGAPGFLEAGTLDVVDAAGIDGATGGEASRLAGVAPVFTHAADAVRHKSTATHRQTIVTRFANVNIMNPEEEF